MADRLASIHGTEQDRCAEREERAMPHATPLSPLHARSKEFFWRGAFPRLQVQYIGSETG